MGITDLLLPWKKPVSGGGARGSWALGGESNGNANTTGMTVLGGENWNSKSVDTSGIAYNPIANDVGQELLARPSNASVTAGVRTEATPAPTEPVAETQNDMALAPTSTGLASGGGGGGAVAVAEPVVAQPVAPTLTDSMLEAFAKLGKYQLGMTEDEINTIFADPEQKAAAIQYTKDQVGKGGLVDEILGYTQAGWDLNQISTALAPGLAASQAGTFNKEYDKSLAQFQAPLTGTFDTAYDPLIASVNAQKDTVNTGIDTQKKTIADTYDFIGETLNQKLTSIANTKDIEEKTLDTDTANFLSEINRQRDAKVRDLELQNKQVSDSYNYALVDAKEAQKAMWRQQRNVFGNMSILGSSEFMQAKAQADVKFNINLSKMHQQKIADITAIENTKQDTYDRVMNMTKEMNDKVLQAKTKLNEWYRTTALEIETKKEYTATERMNKLNLLEQQRMENLNTLTNTVNSLTKEKTLGLYSAQKEAEQLAANRALQMTQMYLTDYNNDVMALITQAAGPAVSQAQIEAATNASNLEMQKFLMNYNVKLMEAQNSGGSGYTPDPTQQALNLANIGAIQDKQAYFDKQELAGILKVMADTTGDYNQVNGYLANLANDPNYTKTIDFPTMQGFVDSMFSNGAVVEDTNNVFNSVFNKSNLNSNSL